ncbi:hypothetical protein [Adhaeretor mobilis]|uniref:Uncharacterized protein n=1 Tax=Adhaeretor mobilis TaxID=1930276 RepID=A0A517MTD5_9BACT|nr:hypothetical protein [Adhaeretor mobilis]QDS98146.1 hypothetical protein HG15A2_14190 [Adhaeretor mobilis]
MKTPNTTNGTPADGEARKQAAHVLLEVRLESYVREARRVLLQALLDNGTATIDDVRAVVTLPDGMNPKVFGAIPGVLARAGIVRRRTWTPTARAIAHARTVSVWELVDSVKAQLWLDRHKPLPELTTGDQLLFDKFDAKKSETPTAGTAGASIASTPSTSVLKTKKRKESNNG